MMRNERRIADPLFRMVPVVMMRWPLDLALKLSVETMKKGSPDAPRPPEAANALAHVAGGDSDGSRLGATSRDDRQSERDGARDASALR